MQEFSRRRLVAGLTGFTCAGSLSRAGERSARHVELDLAAAKSWIRIGDRDAYLDTYNGVLPGPIVEANLGDNVLIHFNNVLPEPTNLHFHGLHVSPEGSADNVMIRGSTR